MAAAPLQPAPDFLAMAPMADEAFDMLRRTTYSYGHTPMNPVVESQVELDSRGRVERVSVDAVYNQERLPIRLHLPGHVEPPYQAVVYFPGINLLWERPGEDEDAPLSWSFEFIVKSGRAFVHPVYAGTRERDDGRIRQRYGSPSSGEDLFFQWFKDVGRTLDYLEDRPDIDASRVAFAGVSVGAGPVARFVLTMEDRFRAALLWSGGFGITGPSANAATFSVPLTRRITTPVLMLNGRYDYGFPVETHQKPFFELLGTPPEHKRHVVFEAGHWPFPRGAFIRENVAWLDKYLGPVERAAK
jgi:dienelactone hydrolase